MRSEETLVPKQATTDRSAMLEAMRSGVLQALQHHQDQGVPAVTWDAETRQIVEIPAEQISTWIKTTTPNP